MIANKERKDKHGPMAAQYGIRPECSTGIVPDTANSVIDMTKTNEKVEF
jgi:hypothetical protein